MLYNLALLLAFVVIFIGVNVVFKNLRQILLWSCKLVTTCYIWAVLWILMELRHLPEWQQQLFDSVWKLANMTNMPHTTDL
tara:strand:+ start:30643 stop:30885 length:243 start_codon:yes stop_codon:yes gene_type:complete